MRSEINYLTNFFHQEYKYNTINFGRSAISAYHDHHESFLVKNHSKVKSLMTCIQNKHPPAPKYVFIWDVEVVLKLKLVY